MSKGKKLTRRSDKNHYALSTPVSPTFYWNQKGSIPDVLIFLRHVELPVGELNSNCVLVLVIVYSSRHIWAASEADLISFKHFSVH